jgi:hypothetical protein
MADLVVGAVTVAVAREGVEHSFREYGGDRVVMEDGSMRVSVKGRKNVWRFRTASPLSGANATSLVNAVIAAPPVTCSGDILGASFSCAGEVHQRQPVSILGTVMYYVSFTLYEV